MAPDAQEPMRAMSKNEIDDLFGDEAAQEKAKQEAQVSPEEGASEAQSSPDLEGSAAPDLGDEPQVQPIEFGQLSSQVAEGEPANIQLLLDVKLPVTVELGRTNLPIKEILDFGPGTIIGLNRMASEPVDLLVNGVLVARAEVVVIDDHFGVRLSSLISPEERIRTLGGGE
ncbi:MAG: flagellar motor switch protein FliN [Candidatus Eisenbacteria sp.]|nr:flagellar motor switch protein FliN [Candidatus Eisenbacteria bacterium]